MSGVHRVEQEEMVEAVAAVMCTPEPPDQSVLLVQAGTGTGKSLGYLAPAITAAAEFDRRTVIATATLALQRQLVERDLPAALAGLPDDASVSAEVLKGRGNYLCRARLDGQGTADDQVELELPGGGGRLEQQAADLRDWARDTETGDRDDYDSPLDARVWRALSVTGRECVGASKCPFAEECFSEIARRRARDADIVVTNHAMLALDALDGADVLPEYEVLVVDEGHELVARVTNAGTVQLGAGVVERAARAARSLLTDDSSERLAEAEDALIAALAELPQQQERLPELSGQVVDALGLVRDSCAIAVSDLTQLTGEEDAARHRAQAGLQEVHDVAGKLLSGGTSAGGSVVWFGGDSDQQLYSAPLQVGDVIGGYLADRLATVVTSATLTLGGGFDTVAEDLGLLDDWASQDVGTPFDYASQGILYVAADLPRPGRDGPDPMLLERLHHLVSAAGGRSLVLLSSWRAVERVEQFLQDNPITDVEVLVQQRGDSVASLVRRFSDDETSVLIGTMSLFQGVDVPGAANLCVIIDKIPFPRPDDPVLAARSEQVDRSGGNGFRAVSIPRAALLLAQGCGRLIRTDSDRGVVAVLDPRLRTAGYGNFLRESLPPFWSTTDTDKVVGALERLVAEPVPDSA
ncbi:MAG: ATP-dependent DNA helicase [Actinomycetia bacterium]|nr:ATP-dependent DNA helicase [Actinomycetes bacterium]MCH9801960.1 ATP-dependent DNA helicase [Actinomycetes bacterium]